MKKSLEISTLNKWLIADIFEPTDIVLSDKIKHPGDVVVAIMQMVDDSMDTLKKKLYSDVPAPTDFFNIADAYVELLCEATTVILIEFGSTTPRYFSFCTSERKEYLKQSFVKVLSSEFKSKILIQLFLNNFLVTHFLGIISSSKMWHVVQDQKKKQQPPKNKK